MTKDIVNAEVISVLPNKVKISIKNLEDFKITGEKLSVGSYLRISDHEECALIAIIENYLIEQKDTDVERSYVIEAIPLGFLDNEGNFTRGGNNIAIPPIDAKPAKKEDIQKIYDSMEINERFCFSKLVQDESIEVPVDGNKFFNKHIAVVGSTGSGKSNTVAKIIQSAISSKTSEYKGLNNSHIVIFDIHSEYKQAFPEGQFIDVNSLKLPYWLLNAEELQDLLIESHEEQSHNQVSVLKKAVVESKRRNFKGDESLKDKIHYDSPVYFDMEEVLKEIKDKNEEMIQGERGQKQGSLHGKLDNFLSRLENKIYDKRLDFIFGDKIKSTTFEDTLRQIISYKKTKESNVTVIDLSGVPFEVLSITVSLISRLLFEYGYYYKKTHAKSLTETPILVVYEEAHKYVPKTDATKYSASRTSIERIAKEGRKYGVTAIIVSQRPSEISETIFSQCSNYISMRLTNPDDQNYVKRLLPDTLGPLTEALPILKAGEGLLIGDAIIMPSLVKIDQCVNTPSSNDIPYLDEWKKEWFDVEFGKLIDKWEK